MTSSSKRNKAIREQLEPGKVYLVDEALALLKKLSGVKFKESVDVAIRLGVDPKKIRPERSWSDRTAQRHRKIGPCRRIHTG